MKRINNLIIAIGVMLIGVKILILTGWPLTIVNILSFIWGWNCGAYFMKNSK